MNSPTKKPDWEGFSFPTRLLTQKERELLTPRCVRCSLPAVAVEVQEPLTTKKAQTQPLVDFASDTLKFYCGYHTTLDVPEEITQDSDDAFFERVARVVWCPKHLYRHHACTCIRHDESCLSKCDAIQALIGDLPADVVKERTERGYANYRKRKNDAKALQQKSQT